MITFNCESCKSTLADSKDTNEVGNGYNKPHVIIRISIVNQDANMYNAKKKDFCCFIK